MGRRAFFLGGIAVSHCLALFMAVLAAYTCSKQPACAAPTMPTHSGGRSAEGLITNPAAKTNVAP